MDPAAIGIACEKMPLDIAIHNIWNIVYAFTLLICICIVVFLVIGLLMQWHAFTHIHKMRKDLNRIMGTRKQQVKIIS